MSSALLVLSPKSAMAVTLKPLNCRLSLNRYMSQAIFEMADSPFPSFRLLGPPEIYQTPAPGKQESVINDQNQNQTQSEAATATSADPFMNSMMANFNNVASAPSNPPMGFTENYSPTFLSSGNPCLDFFFHVVPDTPSDQVQQRLKLAWEQNPLTALKLVCNLRGVRGTGKSDGEGFYASAFWLFENHPKTLASNAASVAKFGYFKDLPEILHRLHHGFDVRKISKEERRIRLQSRRCGRGRRDKQQPRTPSSRRQKALAAAKKAVDMYNNDPAYRFLHDKISDVFATHLMSDLEKLSSGILNNFSLAAKWCPSLYSSYDMSTLLCESIARRIFPRDPEYQDIEDAHYAYRVRDRLRKQVLVPLRKALKLPEIYMSAKQWNILPYNRVASVAMKNYKDLFLKHDRERFEEYLGNVKKGKAKIAAGALLPHMIIKSLKEGTGGEVAVLQWQRMVNDLSAIGKLKNCLAISDVSSSMYGTPMEVSVALGLLVSDLSEEPWKGKVITFSRNPQLQIIEGDDLRAKISCIEELDWDMNTDFQKVFDKILEVAKEHNLTEDQMIKRLFVFSDMEFDQASGVVLPPNYGYHNRGSSPEDFSPANWETDYQAITRKFHDSGYSSVPEIVFWNLRNSAATPVPSHQKGVAMVSGFSKNLLKLFLEEGGVMDPVSTMESAIKGEEYNSLVVVD
ncbi:hypothetical protein CCACVL1_24163 [Corchorus capsularis]|uniref:Plant/T31B5-30 protein n=1 Tax=Corchorus capsularis TaxID=210143 RepID=A0A1R3GQU9_COCAP|nr:hypothetical protein CCACVL1_24163 [Corchorus capsularis]